MQNFIVQFSTVAAALAVLSGCSTSGGYAPKTLISAAEFDAMIKIEVRELEPLPVGQAVAAAR